ncbi:bifunctional phosphopantothenoylcysteine decarboxylase/phosphopantothenate--cysteine ligase CoaBC [Levilactobacillus bambusae]|uniref:Coenzyme A biosynthesis bifunctional protein CoaBC n=1 Tax=Levilactobacillus bambusae TaxID=2024736 RepID=A0A2V1N0V6_9LACO|nr:bifunctional phosphopantothenoylcysteine decarboxylase/phosphopantothenate--cysteine ligase CoaBC [Levilactobacillus bambusae]PWG00921.1 bifunctional phosphopantothenoylcysteine decarboxylase/phosphopantothenate--cysteine ligase CoaBC [Levilactobacillus bambusae]
MQLAHQNVALYVTGSIAAYKAAFLARLLIKAGANVRVVETEAAAELVTPLTFESLTKASVLTTTFTLDHPAQIEHIELADWTDIAIAAPATANFIAQIANGLANDAASLTWLATTGAKFVAPTMNTHMLENPATQRNLAQLEADRVYLLAPEAGFLAEGYEGLGRMPEPETIVTRISEVADEPLTTDNKLAGKRVVVTAGGTREHLDPVRYIGNESSGKMGYAIAQAAVNMGAYVTLVSAPTRLTPPAEAEVIPVESTEEMRDAVVSAFQRSDVLVMAAAPADFRPVAVADQKIKKSADNDRLQVDLVKTPDILKAVAKVKQPGQFTVGFAAETQNLLAFANQKLMDKGVNMLVANDVSQAGIGFNGDQNQVTFLLPDQAPQKTPVLTKTAIAKLIMTKINDVWTV